jgi:hypothetical protein
MASPASKTIPTDLAAALAAALASGKTVTQVPVGAASNVKKSKYVGKKALKGIAQRLGHAPSAYLG